MGKRFGNLTREDLDVVLSLLPLLERERQVIRELIAEKPEKFAQTFFTSGFAWAHLYELPFLQLLGSFLKVTGVTDEFIQASKGEVHVHSLMQLIAEADDQDWQGGSGGQYKPGDLLGYQQAIMGNLDCLVIYGAYLNDLIVQARQGDAKALLKAIRIDPSVPTGPTARSLLSAAVVMNDDEFLAEVRKAMAGKTGRQASYLKKFRFLMQILYEAGALGSPTKEIEALVFEVGAYNDQPGASKNVTELISKAKRLKQQAISN
jgi:hypothetical protein